MSVYNFFYKYDYLSLGETGKFQRRNEKVHPGSLREERFLHQSETGFSAALQRQKWKRTIPIQTLGLHQSQQTI